MIKNKNNQLYIFSLAFFFTHFFFLLYGHNIIRISGNDTLIACLLGIIIDVFLFTITKNIIYKKINPSYLLILELIVFFSKHFIYIHIITITPRNYMIIH